MTDVLFYKGVDFTVIAAYEQAPYTGRLLIVGNDYMFDDAWINTWWDYIEYIPPYVYLRIDYSKIPDNPTLASTTALWAIGDVVSPTVDIVNPTDGEYMKAVLPITISAKDEKSGVDRVELYINGILTFTDMEAPYEFSWNTTELWDGLYSIKAIAYDKAGNTNSTSIDAIVDNTKPALNIISPENGTMVTGSMAVGFFAFDANLFNMTYSIDGGAFVDVTCETNFTVDTTTLTDGTRTIKLMLYDKAGNAIEEGVIITVDNTVPSVSITSPTDGAELNGIVTIDFTASDIGLGKVLLYIDTAVIDVTGTTSYNWETTTIGDGSHTIRLVATDEAGNVEETQITVTTTNVQKAKEESYTTGKEEGYTSGRNFGIMIGVIAGLVIGAIIATVIIKKRS